MVRGLRTLPGPSHDAQAGRMVGRNGRSLPHGVAAVAKIERVEVLMVDLVPKVKRVDAIQSFVSQETPFVRIFADDGTIGTGYTYTIGTGGSAIVELIARSLAPQLIGRDPDRIEEIWKALFFY